MRLFSRLSLFAGTFAVVLLSEAARIIFGINLETYLQAVGAANLLVDGPSTFWRLAMNNFVSEWLAPTIGFLFGDFGFGFVVGAALFALPDIPKVRQWLDDRKKARRAPKFDPVADEELAVSCEELARECLSTEAELRSIRTKEHWRMRGVDVSEDDWVMARQEEASHIERFAKRSSHKLVTILNELSLRGIEVERFYVGMQHTSDFEHTGEVLNKAAILLRRGVHRNPSFQGIVLRPSRF